VIRVFEAAARTTYQAKRKLLARALASAINDDAEIDPAILKVRAVAELEPVHVRALKTLDEAGRPFPGADTSSEVEKKRRGEALGDASRKMPVPVIVTLVNVGAVLPARMVFGSGTTVGDISLFGYDLLRELGDADDADPP
jgi:hypothetical protein